MKNSTLEYVIFTGVLIIMCGVLIFMTGCVVGGPCRNQEAVWPEN